MKIENKKSGAQLWQLFATFFKIGAFTFGGGWAMISIIQREIVERHAWIDKEEFLDLLAVAQSLPGILAVNISVAVGDKLRSLLGSSIAALGTILPSFLIILAIAIFLTPDLITNNPVLSAIFRGIRPAVVALIVAPVITSARAANIGWATAWIPAVVALLIWSKWPVVSNPILYIVLGGLLGWWHLRHSRLALEKKKGGDR
ncbi:MAG: chromate transporter [Muribaculaceae bacterium]|nr:chromate transporter [Muribaculaceae bacterium]